MTEGRNCRKQLGRRLGFVFVFSIIALAALFLLGQISISVAMNSLRTASRERSFQQAFHLAEAAADMAEAELRAQASAPTTQITVPPGGGVVTLGTGTCKATIIPDPGNPGAWLKRYLVVATGTAQQGGMTSTITMQLRQQSFALYAYFTDQERSSVTDGTIWFFARDRLDGPVHSNDRFHIDWDTAASKAIFAGTVSSAAASVDWGNAGTPKEEKHWRRILDGGEPAITLGADYIILPSSTELQRNAAWGSASGFPTTTGVTVPTWAGSVAGGIYVYGDCQVVFSVDAFTGSQVITITQGSRTTTVTVNLATNQTTVQVAGQDPVISQGTPNGVLYCTGNITNLKGTLADNYVQGSLVIRRNGWTIATDVAAGKNVVVTDNLRYKTVPDATLAPDASVNLLAPVLGIVAQDVKLSTSCPSTMTICGVVLAGGQNTANGTFWFEGYNDVKMHTLNLLGGVIQKKRGPVGVFNPSTNALTTGYSKNYVYDTRMVDTPPPYFPTTGQYDLVSWQYR